MEKDFIHRSLKISIIVAVIFAPFLLLYLGPSFTLGFIGGAAWNIANVFLLFQVFTMVLLPATTNKRKGALAGVLKFPVLYGIGYAIISYANVSLYGILIGFSLIFIVFALRALGVYLKNPGSLRRGSFEV